MISVSQDVTVKALLVCVLVTGSSGYFDMGTTTEAYVRDEDVPRQSFFRWQRTEFDRLEFYYHWWDWHDLHQRRRLCIVAGISIDFLPIGVATILNRRTLITSDNMLDAHMYRMKDLRVWCLGRNGLHITPYRYRVWRATRVLPRSLNPEHWHGPRGIHQPRHDISIIHTLDKMYLFYIYPHRYMYAYRAYMAYKRTTLMDDMWFAGSGFEYLEHIYENYKIFFAYVKRKDVVDCSKYLPKWWGKFICIFNRNGLAGVQNGGGLFHGNTIVGLGCFEIRYNEDRVFVFTDLRYYIDWINRWASINPGEYYEYAYPQWGQREMWVYDRYGNYPYIPWWESEVKDDIWPLGK